MDRYTNRLTLAVPEQYITEANHLALLVGESSEDITTFNIPEWIDSEGNLYSICSAAVKPIVLGLLDIDLSTMTIPPHAVDIDIELAQQALDKTIIFTEGLTLDNTKIIACIDLDPFDFFNAIGINRKPLEVPEEPTIENS